MTNKKQAGPAFPVTGKSVTGHEVAVVGILPSSGFYAGEYKSRSIGYWRPTVWNQDGFEGGWANSHALDLASIGVEATEANQHAVDKFKDYKSSYKDGHHTTDADAGEDGDFDNEGIDLSEGGDSDALDVED